ncbi:MAG: response regulator transcription factor [Acidobacteria bacterium]|nr:response regulator transcription factor [Acidobacteriota bacterium]
MQSGQPLHSTSIRVLVAESSPISSQLLAEAIGRDPRIEVLAFSSNPVEIAGTIRKECPDILLISARLEDDETLTGLKILEQLRAEQIATKAVVLVDSSRPDVVVNAFRSGASGVFSRNAPLEMLSKCIAAVNDGQIWANSKELGFVLAALAAYPRIEPLEGNGLAVLSKREREVVHCLAEGQTNRQIAEALGLSQHTVKNYMFKIFEKLGVANRVELVFHVLSQSQGFLPGQDGHSAGVEFQSRPRSQPERRPAPTKFPKPARRFGSHQRGAHSQNSIVEMGAPGGRTKSANAL